MTDLAKKPAQRSNSQLRTKKRKTRTVLFVLLFLSLGAGISILHQDKLYVFTKILNWIKQNNPGEVLASAPANTFRGNIYDRNLRPLAATYKTYAIYARPLELENPDFTAATLSELLGLKKTELLDILRKERGFTWIANGIDQETADIVKQRNIRGIYQVVETKRIYPHHEKGAHVIGFVENGQGLDGIEFKYNTLLRGDEVDREEISSLNFTREAPLKESPTHLVLNLDLMIQSKVERFLDRRVRATGAASGAMIIMNSDTGALLSVASFPPFNPNRFWEFSSGALKNHALTEPVFPGELSLIFQQAAAINHENIRKRLEEYDTGTEKILVIVPEQKKRRKLSSAPAVDHVPSEYFKRFTESLGLNREPVTDIPLKDETPGTPSLLISDPSFNTSALRLLTGFTALVNGGRLVRPHLLNDAYQKGSSSPITTSLNMSQPVAALEPETTGQLSDFLAADWLGLSRSERKKRTPMFFESHRYAPVPKNSMESSADGETTPAEIEPYLSQTVMLGAIEGKQIRLTMIGVLTYPDNTDEIYPDVLETFGNRLSVLSPDKSMIREMLHVAAMDPPTPSSDFLDSEGALFAKNLESPPVQKSGSVELKREDRKNMPDVTGKSLRAGLQALQDLNLEIKLVGSGRIVSQKPAAGTKLNDINECTLKMQQEI